MKYAHLTQIAGFLTHFDKLVSAARSGERVVRLTFSRRAGSPNSNLGANLGEKSADFGANSGENCANLGKKSGENRANLGANSGEFSAQNSAQISAQTPAQTLPNSNLNEFAGEILAQNGAKITDKITTQNGENPAQNLTQNPREFSSNSNLPAGASGLPRAAAARNDGQVAAQNPAQNGEKFSSNSNLTPAAIPTQNPAQNHAQNPTQTLPNSNLTPPQIPAQITLDFDLTNGAIYTPAAPATHAPAPAPATAPAKTFAAPFDHALQKRLNSARILAVSVPPNNRVLVLDAEFAGAYKRVRSRLVFEFTGRFTNAVLIGDDGLVAAALECYENATRRVKLAKPYEPLAPFEIRERAVARVEDFAAFFAGEAARIGGARLAALKAGKIAALKAKIAALDATIAALKDERELFAAADEQARLGGVLAANLWRLEAGAREFELDGERFALQTSPQMAANEHFARAKKLRQKARGAALQRENLAQKRLFLARLCEAAAAAQTADELACLLPKKSAKNAPKARTDELAGVEVFYYDDAKICVGKSARANEELLKWAKKNDWWFHLQGVPSAHIIVRTQKARLGERLAEFAARLCARFSGVGGGDLRGAGANSNLTNSNEKCANGANFGKGVGGAGGANSNLTNLSAKSGAAMSAEIFGGERVGWAVLVDYTQRKNLKVREGAFVNYDNFQTIRVIV